MIQLEKEIFILKKQLFPSGDYVLSALVKDLGHKSVQISKFVDKKSKLSVLDRLTVKMNSGDFSNDIHYKITEVVSIDSNSSAKHIELFSLEQTIVEISSVLFMENDLSNPEVVNLTFDLISTIRAKASGQMDIANAKLITLTASWLTIALNSSGFGLPEQVKSFTSLLAYFEEMTGRKIKSKADLLLLSDSFM